MAACTTKRTTTDAASAPKRKSRKTAKKLSGKTTRGKEPPEDDTPSRADDVAIVQTGSESSASSSVSPPESAPCSTIESGRGHRLRQASVAVILDQVFGPLAKCDPDLWDRRAYLLLVGSAYERMANNEDITTDELVKLARVLAENRRSKAGVLSADSAKVDDTAQPGENRLLPDRFGEMVRDLYGTAMPTSEAPIA